MPESLYVPGATGHFLNNQWYVSILARAGSSTGTVIGSQGSPGGHTYIAFEWINDNHHRHVVFHLVGGRGNSSPGQHGIMGRASVERLEPSNNRPYSSTGGLTGIPPADWSEVNRDTPADWNGTQDISCAGMAVATILGERAIAGCYAYASGNRDTGNFSLVGANVRLGTNCVTFAIDMLRESGVRPNWAMYLWSFISPFQAIRRGRLY